jgi:hypothetical protein
LTAPNLPTLNRSGQPATRSVLFFVCGLATLLAVSGCTGGPTADDLPGQAPASESAAASPAMTPGPSEGVGPQLTAEQLRSVLESVNEAEALNAQVIPDAEFQAAQEKARSAEEIEVTPEECNVYAEAAPEDRAAEATGAAMTFAGESSLQPDSLTLASLPSEEAARAEVEAIRAQLDVCTEYTIVVSGQEITTTVSEIAVDTAADVDLALRTTAQVPGTIQESVTVRAVVGSTVLDVLVGASTDREADIARAARLADLVVAELSVL